MLLDDRHRWARWCLKAEAMAMAVKKAMGEREVKEGARLEKDMRRSYLVSLLSKGDVIWCNLFSTLAGRTKQMYIDWLTLPLVSISLDICMYVNVNMNLNLNLNL